MFCQKSTISKLFHILPILALFFVPAMQPAMASENDQAARLSKYLTLGAKATRLVDSHTSYEFGNPFSPYQTPLSRLEFPLNSWWGGVELAPVLHWRRSAQE